MYQVLYLDRKGVVKISLHPLPSAASLHSMFLVGYLTAPCGTRSLRASCRAVRGRCARQRRIAYHPMGFPQWGRPSAARRAALLTGTYYKLNTPAVLQVDCRGFTTPLGNDACRTGGGTGRSLGRSPMCHPEATGMSVQHVHPTRQLVWADVTGYPLYPEGHPSCSPSQRSPRRPRSTT